MAAESTVLDRFWGELVTGLPGAHCFGATSCGLEGGDRSALPRGPVR
jgi:hypothetical protein